MKIATFNLCNFIEPPSAFYDFENIYTDEQWQKKQQWIVSYLEQYQPDVIGFQEVFSAKALQALVKRADYPYFAVIDKPQPIEDYIYQSPVVAIASKYPIHEVSGVAPTDLAIQLNDASETPFGFSRQPLRATIAVPELGMCDFYVVHFKSKRPMLNDECEPQSTVASNNDERKLNALKSLRHEVLGSWASSCQRGSEAAYLLDAILCRKFENNYPAILMGDFNDDLNTGVLSHLLTHSTRQLSEDENKQFLAGYQLKDSWALFTAGQEINACDAPSISAPFTYYYGARGSRLDYILLSSEFDPNYPENLAEVHGYHVHDKHLINPSYEVDSFSTDHAIVMISLRIRH
ncbi:endonuclease [Photobacterium sanctipauli]|uniref:Endonuclease n=1 Tax=Photobacterium sanctipauli TaxID=1342794 RepID=A0A2T3NVT8_9GAMM|nr:endonuclease [Photobacterium sanctipauli]